METVAIDMKMTAAAEKKTTGSVLPAGCSRTTAAQVRAAARIRSTASAIISVPAGTRGPWPIRPLCRIRRSAARRCSGVSPGRNEMIVFLPSASADACNPGDRLR